MKIEGLKIGAREWVIQRMAGFKLHDHNLGFGGGGQIGGKDGNGYGDGAHLLSVGVGDGPSEGKGDGWYCSFGDSKGGGRGNGFIYNFNKDQGSHELELAA